MHTILGAIIVFLFLVQPFLGLIHHYRFRALRVRTVWSYLHIWYGRNLIALAVINGGLGLRLAKNTNKGKIVYAVVAGFVGVVYLAVALVAGLRRDRKSDGEREAGAGKRAEKTSPVTLQ